VLTVDFFPPVVDDPYTYGAIAAANAMSDVYAMGAEVLVALNVVGFPEDLPPTTLADILRGGAAKVAEGGGVIGAVHPNRIITRGGAKAGDLLYLTKPLGTAIILTAEERDQADPAHVKAAIDSMLTLNRHPSHVACAVGIDAMCDVTGFGLLGHGAEMAKASGVALKIEAGRLPLLPGALDYARAGFGTGGGARNRDALQDSVTIDKEIDEAMTQVLFDPQTSGGLLTAIPRDRGPELERRMTADGFDCWRIGEVVAGSGVKVLP
jgi:selenide,water dikinase